jgi:hypothetical protein
MFFLCCCCPGEGPQIKKYIRRATFSRGGRLESVSISRVVILTPGGEPRANAVAASKKDALVSFIVVSGGTDFFNLPSRANRFCDAPGWTMDIDSEVQGGNIHRVESLRQCRAAICVCVVRVKLQYEMRKPRKVVVCAGWVYLEPVRVFWSNPCPFCAGAAAADFLSVRNTQYSFTDM